jgi:transcriptional regulator with XRE-family HTH domain
MADNLWALREQKKLSVATLASRAGLPIGLIMEYEAGQRSIDARHLGRLARALYIEETEIKLRSDPRPTASAERPMRREELRPPPLPSQAEPAPSTGGFRPRERGPRPVRPPAPPRPPAPARSSQIAHILDLAIRLGRTQAELEAEVGKPLAELDRPAASQLLSVLQTRLREGNTANRHRAYLPEAVDQYELRYLARVQEDGAVLMFSLFDNTTVEGTVVGFGPYSITVRRSDSSEITLNKLAVVSYTRLPAPPAKGVLA